MNFLDSIVKTVRGIVKLRGGTDNTVIGNTSDRLRVDLGGERFPHVNRLDVSTTVTTSGNSGSITCFGMGCLSVDIGVTAISGTNPTIAIAIQVSEDGSDWTTIMTSRRFTTTDAQRLGGIRVAGHIYRFVWTVTGTTPSITFVIDSTLKAYLPERVALIANYSDLNLALVNATSTVFTSANSPFLSLSTRRGADGGNNGQYVIEASNDAVNWDTLTGNITQSPSTTILQNLASFGVFYYYRLRTTSATNVGTRVVDVIWSSHE